MNKSMKIALGIGSGAIAGFAVAMLIKNRIKNKKLAVVSGITAGGIVSAGAAALVLAEEKRKQKRFEYAERKMLPQRDTWFHVGQNMNNETNYVGANNNDDNFSIGEIEGYPESEANAWRASNDKVFTDACNNYNKKYNLTESSEGYISPKMMKA